MKILQICNIDVAVETFLKPLHHALTQQGYIVHYACTNTGMFFQDLQQQGMHMIHVQIDRTIKPLSNLRSIIQLTTLMMKERYDVVHVHIRFNIRSNCSKISGCKTYYLHGPRFLLS